MLAVACMAPSPASAQTQWTGGTSTDWATAGNWSAGVPGPASVAYINSNFASFAPTVGAAGAQAGEVWIGTLATLFSGALTIDGAGTLSTPMGGLFVVGDVGTGTVTVSGGGTLTTGISSVGNQAGAVGTATVTGTNSLWTVIFPYFKIGDSGSGTLNVLAGGRVTTAFTLDVGSDDDATGDVLVSGSGSRLEAGTVNIGTSQNGVSLATSIGDVQVSDSGVLAVTSSLNVGALGKGSLAVDSGGDVTAGSLTIGSSAEGEATFTGAGSTGAVTGAVRVGLNSGGVGTLDVEAGATLTSASGVIGQQAGSTGDVTISGGGSSWTIDAGGFFTSALSIGQSGANSGTGTLSVLDGGSLVLGSLNSAGRFTGFNSAVVTVDGAGSQLTLNPAGILHLFSLGASGAGNQLNVTDGAAFSTGNVDLSTVAGSGVTATVSGAGTSWTSRSVTLGGAGTATAIFTDDATAAIVGDFIVDGAATTSLTISDGAHVTQSDGDGTAQFRLGVDGHGTLWIEEGGVLDTLEHPDFIGFAFLARNAGSSASATITGAGSAWNAEGLVVIGNQGSARLEILDGGTMTGNASARLAFGQGSEGSALVSGPGSSWILDPPSDDLFPLASILIGLGGTGDMRVEDGAHVTASGIGVGSSFNEILFDSNFNIIGSVTHTGSGSLVVTGAGTTVDLNVGAFSSFDAGGDGGTGTIEVLDGAVVIVADQGHFGASTVFSGQDPPQLLGHGTLTVDGAGSSVTYGGTLDIGEQATGILNVRNGGFVSNSDGYLGSFTNSVGSAGNGTATVSGAGSIWQNTGVLRVGDFGTGALNVFDGGLVTNTNGIMAARTGSSATATVSGTNSTWTNTGTLAIGSLGTAVLNVANGGAVSSTGAASINALSTLNLGTGGLAGLLSAPSLANAGLLRFNHTGDFTFNVPTSGAGNVIKAGNGTTTLAGTHTYTGTTTVNSGTLLVNGTVAGSAFTVNNGAFLGGSGILGALTAASGGTVAPGNSVGTLEAATAMFDAGSLFEVEIDPLTSDRLIVTGTATISSDAMVRVLPMAGTYSDGFEYLILDASSGARVGEFGGIVESSAFLDFTLDHDKNANQVWLTVFNVAAFPDVAETPNQMATAEALEALGPGNPTFDAILVLDDDEARNAFDLASGEVHATLAGALVDDSRFVREAIIDRLRQRFDSAFRPAALGYAAEEDGAAFPPSGPVVAAWANGFANAGAFAGDGNAAAFDRRLGGAVGGVDLTLAEGWRFGLAGGLQAARIDVPDRASSAGIDTAHVAAYGGLTGETFAVRFGGAFAWHQVATTRDVAFPGFSDRLTASYGARTAQVFGEAGIPMEVGGVAVEPFAGLAHVHVATDGFAESGGPAALSAPASSASVTYSALGARFATAFGDGRTRLHAMAAWQHAFGSLAPMTMPAFAGGDPFAIAGVPIARDALRLELGVGSAIGAGATASLLYSGMIASGVRDHGVKGKLAVTF